MNANDGRTIHGAVVNISISAGNYGEVLSGSLRVVDSRNPQRAYLAEMPPGSSYTINNTMIADGSVQMTGGEFDDSFVNEVLRIGYLPEGTYTLRFELTGYYDQITDVFDPGMSPLSISESIEIRNPRPPELVTPTDEDSDMVAIPRFAWQRPRVSDYSAIGRRVEISYTINVWKMFTRNGSLLQEEEAINSIPIWTVRGWQSESIDFNPGTATEELLAGHRYCWQVQAFDGTGRPIGVYNDGKSDIWQFTVQFIPPVIDEVTSFDPLRFRWSPARSGGTPVQYNVRVAGNPEFSGAYIVRGLTLNSMIYPPEAPSLELGSTAYIEVQAVDDSGAPIGEPAVMSFTIPSQEVTLQLPEDGADISTLTPSFTWQGAAQYYTVTIGDNDGHQVYESNAITSRNWRYDGDALTPGVTYSWTVTPADASGAKIGGSSETRDFTVPATDQVVLVEPVGASVSTVQPVFRWRPFTAATASAAAVSGRMTYRITITGQNDEIVHSAESYASEYTYPSDAPVLEYGAVYRWQVIAMMNDAAVSREGAPAVFMTPYAGSRRDMATTQDIQRIIERLIMQYPELARIQDKILAGLADENGAITPVQFIELLEQYRITAVRLR